MSFKALMKSTFSQMLKKSPSTSKVTQDHEMDHKYPDLQIPPVIPRVKGEPRLLGLVGDARYNRDSCNSVRLGGRSFWTWRDTQTVHNNGQIQVLPILASTASWSDHDAAGSPAFENLQPSNDPLQVIVLRQYGENSPDAAYFPILNAGCEPLAGMREDGSRRAIWPDSPPLIAATAEDGVITAYTWVRNAHIGPDLSVITKQPATTLYRIIYNPACSKTVLPSVIVVDPTFWKDNEIPYGAYGHVAIDGIAYLYGQAEGRTALARVPLPLIEQRSAYEFWVGGKWTRTQPGISDPRTDVPNANAGGQGTYYYSKPWQCYVWIGGSIFPGADMYITTAPAPTGPWIKPFKFYSAVNGNHGLPAYSIQAHPRLLANENENGIYVTYTKCDVGANNEVIYTSPLVYVEWEDNKAN